MKDSICKKVLRIQRDCYVMELPISGVRSKLRSMCDLIQLTENML